MWVVRLDKYLANLGIVSRRKIWKIISKWKIYVNWEIVRKSDFKVNFNDEISIVWDNWKIIKIKVIKNIIVLLNKPRWYICSDIDEFNYPSYKRLLYNCPYKNILKLAWRLDVDTEGLLVLSDNWNFIHKLISPKHWKEKIYYVEVENELSEYDINKLESWVDIWWYISLPAKVYKLEDPAYNKLFKDIETINQIPKNLLKWNYWFLLSIREGKFHQIKRMLQVVSNKVIYLKRLKMWDFELWSLEIWEWKLLENKI